MEPTCGDCKFFGPGGEYRHLPKLFLSWPKGTCQFKEYDFNQSTIPCEHFISQE